MNKIKTGKLGEEIAIRYLCKKGYTINSRNYYGNHGEIDIIASKNNEIVFVEVKTRSNLKFGYPEDSFSKRKRIQLLKAIDHYLVDHEIECCYHIDLVCVEINKKEWKAKIRHFKNVIIDI